jgi:CRP-like cAMP-binding protein
MFKNFLDYITSLEPFSLQEIELITNRLQVKYFKKKEYLLRKGEVCKYLYIVNKGCLRTYSFGESMNECTRCLAFGNSFCTVLSSFLTQNPSPEFIQALESTEVLAINLNDFQMLRKTIYSWEKIYLMHLEKLCISYASRIDSLININAKERYDLLIRENPAIVLKLPNKVVASYIGVTQESLSRLKSPAIARRRLQDRKSGTGL